VEVAKARNPEVPAARYVPDVSRITSRLPVAVWIGLEESIRRTLEFNRLNPA
jgi:hypothetical protein